MRKPYVEKDSFIRSTTYGNSINKGKELSICSQIEMKKMTYRRIIQ